jgi:hypothetical protein
MNRSINALIATVTALLGLGALPVVAHAADAVPSGGVYKCERGGGLIEYGNGSPLPAGCKYVNIDTAPVVTIPAPRSSISKGTPAARPADFPRVDASAQKSRDDDRRRVLESELKVQEDHLDELKKEYNNGEPERQGNEKNYQKYLERTSQLKEDIGRSEANVASIRRELSNLQATN